LQRRMNLLLLVILATGLIVASASFGLGEVKRVRAEVLERANLLMDMANVTRLYTNDEVRPLFLYQGETFHKAMVPSYASRKITEALVAKPHYAGYSIREAALRPINANNRADDWEAGKIKEFMDGAPPGGYDPEDLPSLSGERTLPDGDVFFLAEPIVVPPEAKFGCLSCHGPEADAPAAMLVDYPGAAGFGWLEGQVVGAQIVTVPIVLALKHRRERMITLLLSLVAVFTLIYVSASYILSRNFLRPMKRVTELADRMSRGEEAEWLNEDLPGEQGKLAAAINRLKRSQDKAIELAERSADGAGRDPDSTW
jgi:hypothetical protein